jgi:uncharacterized phage infection (PIP) family protein YhgE
MRSIWAWIAAILIGVFILALIFGGGSSRQAYRAARGTIDQQVEQSQDRVQAVADAAAAAVDLALEQSAQLPAQEAKAEAITRGIEEINQVLQEAAELRGDLAMTRLDASIELFNNTVDTVEEASREASSPAVKARLDYILGSLEAVRKIVSQAVLATP